MYTILLQPGRFPIVIGGPAGKALCGLDTTDSQGFCSHYISVGLYPIPGWLVSRTIAACIEKPVRNVQAPVAPRTQPRIKLWPVDRSCGQAAVSGAEVVVGVEFTKKKWVVVFRGNLRTCIFASFAKFRRVFLFLFFTSFPLFGMWLWE